MAYNGANLSQIGGTIEGAFKLWVYTTADSLSTVKGAGYISDGGIRGMEAGDFVFVINTATPAYAIYAAGAPSSGAVTLAGTDIVLT